MASGTLKEQLTKVAISGNVALLRKSITKYAVTAQDIIDGPIWTILVDAPLESIEAIFDALDIVGVATRETSISHVCVVCRRGNSLIIENIFERFEAFLEDAEYQVLNSVVQSGHLGSTQFVVEYLHVRVDLLQLAYQTATFLELVDTMEYIENRLMWRRDHTWFYNAFKTAIQQAKIDAVGHMVTVVSKGDLLANGVLEEAIGGPLDILQIIVDTHTIVAADLTDSIRAAIADCDTPDVADFLAVQFGPK